MDINKETQTSSITIGCDYIEGDKVLGRFTATFPAGSTQDGRASFLKELAAFEEAIKHAKPLSFGDLDWRDPKQSAQVW